MATLLEVLAGMVLASTLAITLAVLGAAELRRRISQDEAQREAPFPRAGLARRRPAHSPVASLSARRAVRVTSAVTTTVARSPSPRTA